MNPFLEKKRPLEGLRLRDMRAVIIVFCCGLAVTALTAFKLADIERERNRLQFDNHVAAARHAVMERVETSVALLRGASGLIAANGGEVRADEFRRYIGQLDLREQYRGVLGIGWSRRLAAAEMSSFVAAVRAEGMRGFHVWPVRPRDEYHTIVYLEPLDERNRAAIGYDMYTEPVREAAMIRARDTGAPAATGRVRLVQEISPEKQPGFLIYLPVYRGAAVPSTEEARRERLLGFAYAPLRAGDFLSEAFAHESHPSVSVAIYDGSEASAAALLFRREATEGGGGRLVQISTVEVAGTPWTMVFESAGSAAAVWPTVVAALAAGLVLSLLLALFIWREAQGKVRVARSLARERAARNDAERASLLKDEFLATLSHELRTPLNAILGWAHVVRSGKASVEQVHTGLDAIERNAKVQVRLIDELLDMSRIVSGKLQMDMQPIELGQVVSAAVQSVLPSSEQKGLHLEQQLLASTPVRGDPARLQQVVSNLLANAVKFTPEGGRVTVRLEQARAAVRLTVSDTGVGIEPEFLPYVFERFRQADASRTRRHGGLGLGLSIVRHLVELHGGRVSAYSAGYGKGATFVVTLPQGEMDARETEGPVIGAERASEDGLPPLTDFAGMRILVVDDEQDARDLVRHLLEERGAEVHTAAGAQEALAMLRGLEADVLLSDIGMPGMDGYELIRRVRALKHGELHAIAISAYARAEDRTRALDAGYDAYLVKPLHPVSLLRAVSYFVARVRRVTPRKMEVGR